MAEAQRLCGNRSRNYLLLFAAFEPPSGRGTDLGLASALWPRGENDPRPGEEKMSMCKKSQFDTYHLYTFVINRRHVEQGKSCAAKDIGPSVAH